MKQGIFTVTENVCIAPNVFRMTLRGDVSAFTAPGQFADLRLPELYLRRPISVFDLGEDSLRLIYKRVGKGTAELCALPVGTALDVLTGLGNGYDTAKSGPRPLLLGGGVGIPPLYLLAKRLVAEGKEVSVVLGFNAAQEVFCEEEFRALGCSVTVTTADGSYGRRGFVTDALPEDFSYVYACGPLPMLKAVCGATATSGQFSFEERMGCGFGACMGCSIMTKNGPRRVCKDGPVLEKEEILW